MERKESYIEFKNKKELPPNVRKVLEIAFLEYPEFKNINIKTFSPRDDFDAGGYYKFIEDKRGEPIAQICISEGDAKLLVPLLDIRKSSVTMNAQMLGIDSSKMSPELLQIFIITHELGHIRDYQVNFASDPDLEGWEAVDEMAYQREAVLTMLPIRNINPTDLARELAGVENLQEVLDRFPEIKEYPGFEDINSIDDVLFAQEREYRLSAPEIYADKFASNFIKKHAFTILWKKQKR